MDSDFVDKVVLEVKSQGVFDDFRKDTLADVDTKPAYQNLRNRVEAAVSAFLKDRIWTPETNKIQLREKLRKHMLELGFLDVGVERIVDQVVNPKIATVFQPQIEMIAYKYLGITPPEQQSAPPLPPEPTILTPSLPPMGNINGSMLNIETAGGMLPTDLEQISPDSDRATIKSDVKDDDDDDYDELPPGVDADEDISPPFEPIVKANSLQSKDELREEEKEDSVVADTGQEDTVISTHTIESVKEVVGASLDAGASQESQLSQVSSDSRITATSSMSCPDTDQPKQTLLTPNAAVNISEEAQMPSFNENSREPSAATNGTDLHFDIKKETIKFEGTERRTSITDSVGNSEIGKSFNVEDAIMSEVKKNLEIQNDETPEMDKHREPSTPIAPDSSFGSCSDETQNSNIVKPKLDEQLKENNNTIKPKETEPTQTTVTNAPATPEVEQKDLSKDELIKPSTPSSTSSSRHKHKHNKDKHYHHSDDKHRRKSRSRDRNRSINDKSHSHSKHSSSSSSKHNTSASSKHSSHKSSRRDKSASAHSSTSSSRSSTAQDSSSKRSDHRDNGRKSHTKSSSSSSKSEHKERSNSSTKSSQKTERQRHKSSVHDDHNESKAKIQRRKSNDSNDEGRNPNSKSNTATLLNAISPPKGKNNCTANGTDEVKNGTGNQNTNGCQQIKNFEANVSNVIILNDILEHPSTDYIELTADGGQVIKSHIICDAEPMAQQMEATKDIGLIVNQCVEQIGTEPPLQYFDDNEKYFAIRLHEIDSLIEAVGTTINEYRQMETTFGCLEESLGIETEFKESPPTEMHIDCGGTDESSSEKNSSISQEESSDDADDDDNEFCAPQRKRVRRDNNDNPPKTSPTLSDASSVNSKENEAFEKQDSDADETHLNSKLSGASLSKLCQQQRYNNDDLYKPRRPVLASQRSRRRHLDSIP